MLETRDWDYFTSAAVYAACERHLKEQMAVGHPWAKFANVSTGYRAIVEGRVGAVVTGGYLLVYDYGPLLYFDKPVLFEQVVIKLHPEDAGDFRAVVESLDRLARRHGCVGIIAGNAIGRRGLTRVYERAGFTKVTEGLFKEIQ